MNTEHIFLINFDLIINSMGTNFGKELLNLLIKTFTLTINFNPNFNSNLNPNPNLNIL